MWHCSTSRLHATNRAEYQEENISMDNSTLMTAQMRWEEKRVSTNHLRATVKHRQTKVKSNNDGEERALWYQHAPQRHNRPMQWHDLVTLMLALSAFDIRQFLSTGQSRKVFYTDKGFFFSRDPYVHVMKRISQSCGQGSLLHKCRSHSPKWLYYVVTVPFQTIMGCKRR